MPTFYVQYVNIELGTAHVESVVADDESDAMDRFIEKCDAIGREIFVNTAVSETEKLPPERLVKFVGKNMTEFEAEFGPKGPSRGSGLSIYTYDIDGQTFWVGTAGGRTIYYVRQKP